MTETCRARRKFQFARTQILTLGGAGDRTFTNAAGGMGQLVGQLGWWARGLTCKAVSVPACVRKIINLSKSYGWTTQKLFN